ncbi:universal stress protein [Saccharopolyspora rosea]|uniref:Universal stress protein n=1 Tax=Saccharopolyspora rosea TaxID=524884 RepID=A0ABW3FQB2_9PSEU|nr:universal stress protein [Saccharopolyspora rosea]
MTDAKPRIVVGVDGSPGSRAALRWALRYAELSDGDVTALIASGPPVFIDLAVPMPGDDAADRADRELHEAVEETTALLGSDVHVNRVVVQDHPARALVDEARGADLLVVGHRGRGGFVGAVLGSVSRHCVNHASCSVVVVRRPHEDGH